jgi:hypothetical protein
VWDSKKGADGSVYEKQSDEAACNRWRKLFALLSRNVLQALQFLCIPDGAVSIFFPDPGRMMNGWVSDACRERLLNRVPVYPPMRDHSRYFSIYSFRPIRYNPA